MICHVLPGDAQVAEFERTGLAGEVIVCREALIAGPVDAESLDEFWDRRARFILSEYGDDTIAYHEKVADPLSRLTELDSTDDVNLWFEYELFCSVNMWFCLSLLRDTGATVYRVEPIGLDEAERWDGFGNFNSDDMLAAYELRSAFTDDDIRLGAELWRAYSRSEHSHLRELAARATDRFPYLGEVIAAANEQATRPTEVLREILSHDPRADFSTVFVEFKKRAGVYGYGDTQVQRLLDHLSSS